MLPSPSKLKFSSDNSTMSSDDDTTTSRRNPPRPPPRPPPPFPPPTRTVSKPWILLWATAILVLVAALSMNPSTTTTTTTTRTIRHLLPQELKSLLRQQRHPFGVNLMHQLLGRVLRRSKPTGGTAPSASPRPPCVLWMAPFLSGGGYSSEAWSYVAALDASITGPAGPRVRLRIAQHGDLVSFEFWDGLPDELKLLGNKLHATECGMNETIVVCHSEPGAWRPPLYETPPCPPVGYGEAMAVVGRTMFETDRLAPEHVRRCNMMDAVWVPTDFHVASFVDSGVDAGKVVKVAQPVDVAFFDPSKHEALALPDAGAQLVLGSYSGGGSSIRRGFVFLSVFKWEHRKGWDVLLKAYLEEFTGSDGVALHLLVSAYHSDSDFAAKITAFVKDSNLRRPTDGWPPIHVMADHVPQSQLPGVYKAADAFVLPTRGEGWGRPIVEAMAMALPVIATNWSGPTEYLTEENGYPLAVESMREVTEGPFEGHRRAEPSVVGLRALMRRVVQQPDEARRKGRNARDDMAARFSPEVVADLAIDQVMKVAEANKSWNRERRSSG